MNKDPLLLIEEMTQTGFDTDLAQVHARRVQELAEHGAALSVRRYEAVPGWGPAGGFDAELARRQSTLPRASVLYADLPASAGTIPSSPHPKGIDAFQDSYRRLPIADQSNADHLDICGPFLMLNWWDVADEPSVSVMDEWWNVEHMPILMNTPGRLRIRRFERVSARSPRRFLVLHDLESLDVLSDPNESAVLTHWRARAIQGRRDFERGVYRLAIRADAAIGTRS